MIKQNDIIKEELIYRLGDTDIKLNITKSKNNEGLIYFHPHEDETTSRNLAEQIILRFGGELYALHHNGERLITFIMDKKTWLIDPNRMFSNDGIRNNLAKYAKISKDTIPSHIVDAVLYFAYWVSGVISAGRVCAIHNNFNKNYNILSYQNDDGTKANGVKDIYINENNSTGNFIYTTNATLFAMAKQNGINTVLQSDDVEDDGSYAVFAQKHNIDYTNIEAELYDVSNNNKLLYFVNYFYHQYDLYKKTWDILKKGDLIDLVASSSAYKDEDIAIIENILTGLGFRVRSTYAEQCHTVTKPYCDTGLKTRNIYMPQDTSNGLAYANTIENRVELLLAAINDPESKAVWEVRGGAGSSNLLPFLLGVPQPKKIKPLIGFSDTTALSMFLSQIWGWPNIHGALAEFNTEVNNVTKDKTTNDDTSITSVTDILYGKIDYLTYQKLIPLNTYAENTIQIDTYLIGGNLTLVCLLLGTPFEGSSNNRTIILEDIGNTPQQLSRFLSQINFSDFGNNADAIIMGDFLHKEIGDSDETTRLNNLVINDFAKNINIPVFRYNKFGHGRINNPMPINTKTKIYKNGDNFDIKIAIR